MNNEIIVNNNIPLDIYQTWFTKDLPPGMINSINQLKKIILNLLFIYLMMMTVKILLKKILE